MSFDLSSIGLTSIKKALNFLHAAKTDSLIEYTQPARVEPIVMIGGDCLFTEALPLVQQSVLSLFAGYYLQAVAINASVGKVSVHKTLDKLNPTRSPSNAILTGDLWLMAEEAYVDRLPIPGDVRTIADRLSFEEMGRDEIAEAQLKLNYSKFDFDANKYYFEKGLKEADVRRRIQEADRNYELNLKQYSRQEAEAMRRVELEEQRIINEKDKDAFLREQAGIKNLNDKERLELDRARANLDKKRYEDDLKRSSFGFGNDTVKTLKEIADLSVGKIFMVDIEDGLHRLQLPVSIRLMASSLPPKQLVHILSHDSKDTSVKERFHAWRSGRLEFWRDIVACSDLIDAHRDTIMKDKTGIYSDILKRNRTNQFAALLSGDPSIATASNIAIISDDTASQIEDEIGGRLHDFKTRQKIFAKTYLMFLVVIDKQYERVTFYHRGINQATELGVRDLKASQKGNGPDVSEILRAYTMGQNPRL